MDELAALSFPSFVTYRRACWTMAMKFTRCFAVHCERRHFANCGNVLCATPGRRSKPMA